VSYPYKVEIFDRDFNYIGFAPIERPTITFDYLSYEDVVVITTSIEASKGQYAHITDVYGATVYQGYVKSVEAGSNGITALTLAPLISLFDVEAAVGTPTQASVEAQLAAIIDALFYSNADALQNITGFGGCTTTSATSGSLNYDNEVQNVYNLIVSAMTAYGVVVDASFNPKTETYSITIGKPSGSITVEPTLEGVIERSITLEDAYGALNKITLIDADGVEADVVYYLHTDGTVSTTNADRVEPVFFTTKTIRATSDLTFAEVAENEANAALLPQAYNNLIELTVPLGSRVIPTDMPIGQECQILIDGASYTTALTGFEINGNIKRLTFGTVRIELTKKLKMR